MFDDIIDIAAKSAPLIGTLLGGPAGAAVGGLIAQVAGVQPEELTTHMAGLTPEKQAELLIKTQETKKAELESLIEQHKTIKEIALAEEKTKQNADNSTDEYVRRTRHVIARGMFYFLVCAFVFFCGLLAIDTFASYNVDVTLLTAIVSLFGTMLTMFALAVVVLVGGRSLEKIAAMLIKKKLGI